MLTMSHSCSSSDRGSWKESYRPPTDGGGETVTDLVESSEDSVDSDNSSTSSSLAGSRLQSSNSQPPIGCITTHCVSAAIRPERKMPPIDPLQFVKIQKNELCKKAVEQIKLAEKVKITKEKIKETEEEWQNNLMSWKSKRKLTKNSSEDESLAPITNRKTKTFSEILSEKARSGARIGYNLHHYLGMEGENDEQAQAAFEASHNAQMMADLQAEEEDCINNGNNNNGQLQQPHQYYYNSSDDSEDNPVTSSLQGMMESAQMEQQQQHRATSNGNRSTPIDTNESNLNRLLKSKMDDANCINDNNVDRSDNGGGDQFCRNGLGEVVVFDTTLLQEFATKSDSNCDTTGNQMNNSYHYHQNNNSRNAIVDDDQLLNKASEELPQELRDNAYEPCNKSTTVSAPSQYQSAAISNESKSGSYCQNSVDKNQSSLVAQQSPNVNSQKVIVPINEWKSSHSSSNCKPQNPRQQSLSISSDDDFNHPNSSFDAEDEEDELDEELERLRIDQERSFKAKLHAFESLAKQEEEAARKATEACRMRQQSRAKLAAERSKSLGNIQQSSTQTKKQVTTSYSISSSSLQNNNESTRKNQPKADQSKSLQNINNSSDEYQPASSSNTVIYNFTENAKSSLVSKEIKEKSIPLVRTEPQLKPELQSVSTPQPQQVNSASSAVIDQHELSSQSQSHMNIYENFTPHSLPQQQQPQLIAESVSAAQPELSPGYSSNDSNTIRNASQKLLQQQQQIYQNQPLPGHFQVQTYPQNSSDHYSNISSVANNYGPYSSHAAPNSIDLPVQPTDSILNDKVVNPVPIRNYSMSDEVGLPPIQITKTTQSAQPSLYNKPISQPPAATAQSSKSVPTLVNNNEEEHLYVNQNQLMINTGVANPNTKIPIYDYHHANLPNYDSYNNNNNQIINEYYSEPNYENKAILLQQRMEEQAVGNVMNANGMYPGADQQQYCSSPNNAYPNQQQQQQQFKLYYPKPYCPTNGTVKPVPKQSQQQQQQPQLVQANNASRVPVPAADSLSHNTRYAQGGAQNGHHVAYNQNHWLLQEAELRRQLDSIESNSQRSKNSNGIQHVQHHSKNGGGYLSVSGKKKCSSCGDELGKGCAAMVVESLSLYYHINCFRCSVCNVQLGNGTVGTDVRVRNNKLHCQNCYSNDEAGLKFSRV